MQIFFLIFLGGPMGPIHLDGASEGELSICLVAAKRPSNTVTDTREESLAVDA